MRVACSHHRCRCYNRRRRRVAIAEERRNEKEYVCDRRLLQVRECEQQKAVTVTATRATAAVAVFDAVRVNVSVAMRHELCARLLPLLPLLSESERRRSSVSASAFVSPAMVRV